MTQIHAHKGLAYDLRQRINPAYATQRGTESYERRECAEAIEDLIAQVEALTAERDAVLQQAQQWKQEARTQASIVRECYQACTGSTGEPGD